MKTILTNVLSLLLLVLAGSSGLPARAATTPYNIGISCSLEDPIQPGTLRMPGPADMTCEPAAKDTAFQVADAYGLKTPVTVAFEGRVFDLYLENRATPHTVDGTAILFNGTKSCDLGQVRSLFKDGGGAYAVEEKTGQALSLDLHSIGNGYAGTLGPCAFKTTN